MSEPMYLPESMKACEWLLVVGMHRSGTSAVTGVIHELGFGIPQGADLMQGGADNPNHFESWAMTAFNDELLEFLGGTWDSPPRLKKGWEYAPDLEPWYARAGEKITHVFPDPCEPIVWKDPRNCFLLPFWKRFFGKKLKIVFVWRNPYEVSQSLQKRNNFSIKQGLRLWELSNFSVLRFFPKKDRIILYYNAMLSDINYTSSILGSWIEREFSSNIAVTSGKLKASAKQVEVACYHNNENDVSLLSKKQKMLVAILRLYTANNFQASTVKSSLMKYFLSFLLK